MADYPVADYVPMEDTALTDGERWPLLTDAGAALLHRLREHPHAPRYNHACGDRLTGAARDRLRAYRAVLAGGRTHDGEPTWVPELINRVYATVPRYRRSGPTPDDLRAVPTIGRHDLLSRVEEHVPDDADLSDLIVYRTSGSRGPAATVPMTPEFCALDLPVIEHVLAGLGGRGTRRPGPGVAGQRVLPAGGLPVRVGVELSRRRWPGEDQPASVRLARTRRPGVLFGRLRSRAVHRQPDLAGGPRRAAHRRPAQCGAERRDGVGRRPAPPAGGPVRLPRG